MKESERTRDEVPLVNASGQSRQQCQAAHTIYVISASSLMGDLCYGLSGGLMSRRSAACEAVRLLIRQRAIVRPTDTLSVVATGLWSQFAIPPTPAAQIFSERTLRSVFVGPFSLYHTGISKAVEVLSKVSLKVERSIVFLGDGFTWSESKLIDAVQRAGDAGISVYSIGIGRLSNQRFNEAFMRRIGNTTTVGGYTNIHSLKPVYDAVLEHELNRLANGLFVNGHTWAADASKISGFAT